MEIFQAIITNVVLLFGLVFIMNLSNNKPEQKKLVTKIIFGVFIGIITIMVMINAWEMNTGAIFDTRSVLISVASLFFSTISASIATIIAIIYRISIGGEGVYAGVLTLFFAFSIGFLWKNFFMKKVKINKYLSIYLFGLLVHVFMMLSQLTFPYPKNIEVLISVGPTVILVYPIAVLLLSMAIINHNQRILSQEIIHINEEKYKTLFENSKLGIIQYNLDGIIELTNDAFCEIIGVPRNETVGYNMAKLPDLGVVDAVKKSLSGEVIIYEDYDVKYLSDKTISGRIQFSPIYNDDEVIGGIGIIEDLKEQKELKKNIEILRKQDILTKLYNRAAFDEFIFTKTSEAHYPITIATCDINTFQVINTSFGYDVGNEVLIEISNILIEHAQENANFHPYRIGGDEFAVIMLNTSKSDGDKIISKIQEKINDISKFDFNICISCGVNTTYSSITSITDAFNNALSNMMSNKIYDGSSISIKTIDVIMNTLFEKNKRERMHSERVSKISRRIAELYSLGTAFTNRTELAGKLHDIGKITISEEILDKPGKLSDPEWQKIRKHPETSFKILSTVSEYLDVANVVLSHHERYDGLGYPRGLKEHKIPLEARIISVADSFDAMTVSRPYRTAMNIDEAVEEIKKNSGTQFDPMVVDKFLIMYANNEL